MKGPARLGPGGTAALFAASAYLGFAVAVTWPLVVDIGAQVPGDLGDPLLNTWILWWDMTRLSRLELAGLFDGNVMYPYPLALAFSENLLVPAASLLPVWWIAGNPIVVYNVAYLGAFVAAGMGAYLLAWELTRSRLGAFVAGLVFAFAPYRVAQAGHLQVLLSAGLPLLAWSLVRLARTERRRYAALAGVLAWSQLCTNLYFAVYAALAGPLFLLLAAAAFRRLCSPTLWRRAAIAGVAVALAAVPVVAPYVELHGLLGLGRELAGIPSLDSPARLLGVSAGHLLWGPAFAGVDVPEGGMFPGAVALLLALVALTSRSVPASIRGGASVFIVLGLLVVIGPGAHADLGPVRLDLGWPYRALYSALPGFDGLRVPTRFWVVVMLALAVLAAAGTRRLQRWPRLTALLVLILPLEYAATVNVRSFPRWQGPPAIYQTLARLPRGPVLELPQRDKFLHLFNATVHGQPTYVEHTGYVSPIAPEITAIERVDTARSLALLEALGIRYLVVRHGEEALAPAEPGEGMRTVTRGPFGTIYELNGRPRFFAPADHLGRATLTRLAPCRLDARVAVRAAALAPVVARRTRWPARVELVTGGERVATVDAELVVPPLSDGDDVAITTVAIPCDARFDHARLVVDGTVLP